MAVTVMMTAGNTGTMGVVRRHCRDDGHGGDHDEHGDPSPECMVTTVTAAMTTVPWALSQAQDPAVTTPLYLLSSVPHQDPQQQRLESSAGSSRQN